MRRRLFNLLAGVSLVLCAATGTLWVCSDSSLDQALNARSSSGDIRSISRSTSMTGQWHMRSGAATTAVFGRDGRDSRVCGGASVAAHTAETAVPRDARSP